MKKPMPKKFTDAIQSKGFEVDTYWIYLKPGWISPMDEAHSIAESTEKQAFKKLKWIETCDCVECKELLGVRS